MTTAKHPLTIFVHAEAKVGKSRLGDTAPKPMLFLDAEGRARFTPSKKVMWDPQREEPPVPDGTWETAVVRVTNPDVLQLAYQWLESRQHPFKSAFVDSLMEVQKRFVDRIAGLQQLTQEQWGELARRLESMVRSYRDLTNDPDNPLECVVFSCGTKNDNGTMRPLLQGSAQVNLAYVFDTLGYMYVVPDESQPDGLSRQLLLKPTPGFVAGDNTGAFPGLITNPNIEQMAAMTAPLTEGGS